MGVEADQIYTATQLSSAMPDSRKTSGAKLIKREPRIQDECQRHQGKHSINSAPLKDLVAESNPGGALDSCLTVQHSPLGWPRFQHAGK